MEIELIISILSFNIKLADLNRNDYFNVII